MTTKICKRVQFPHVGLSAFYKAFKAYILSDVYEFNTIILGHFQKAIQVIAQKKADPKYLSHGPFNPICILTPNVPEMVQQTDFVWKFSSMHPLMINMFQKIYSFQDGTAFNIMTRRMTGNIEYRIFADSVMEIHDINMALLDAFRGIGRWLPIEDLQMHIVLNDTIRLYTEQGVNILDWNKANMGKEFFRGLGTDKYYIPVKIDPIFNLQSISDMSNFYGGDVLPEYSLGGTISYEIEVPALITVVTEYDIVKIDFTFDVDYTHGDSNGTVGTSVGNFDTESRNDLDAPASTTQDKKFPDYYNGDITIIDGNIYNPLDEETSKYVKIIDEYTYQICTTTGTALTYPQSIPDVPFNLLLSNIAVLINNRILPKSDYEVLDEHTLSIKKGPAITEGCITVTIYQFYYMKCQKRG